MYCLDTNVIIAIFRGDRELAKKIVSINPDDISFTVISLCELFKGAYKSKQREQSLKLIYDFASNYELLGLTQNSCEIFGKDFNALDNVGKQTEQFDLLTASIAKENNLILITRNKKHFTNISDLQLEEW